MLWRRSIIFFLRFIRYFLASTLVAVIIATLAECQPFYHYWQVVPDPGTACRSGYANLITMGACSVMTDLLLVAFPIPIILMAKMPWKRKLLLVCLFALSLILVIVTCYRVPTVIEQHGSQQYRSLLASLEILASTAVSNTVVIGSFVRDKGAKKTKFKRDQASASVNNNMDQSSVRRHTVTHHQWGSDSDLAADLGMRLEPELYSGEAKLPPLPSAGPYHALSARTGSLDPNWCFKRQSMGSDDSKMSGSATDSVDIKVSPHEYIETNNTPRKQSGDTGIASPRRVSLMDPGGLLDSVSTQDPEAVPRPGSMASSLHSSTTRIRSPSASASPNFSRPGVVAGRSYPNGHGRRGSTYSSSSLDSAPPYRGPPDLSASIDEDVELQDVGGLFSRHL